MADYDVSKGKSGKGTEALGGRPSVSQVTLTNVGDTFSEGQE